MDIVLDRILSLIPRKEDGSFKHGALKDFANSIGLKSGNLISDWMNNRSKSYYSYLYEISVKYNVSVEWLKGETDEKKPAAPEGNGLSAEAMELLRLYDSAPSELRAAALAVLKSAESHRSTQDDESENL